MKNFKKIFFIAFSFFNFTHLLAMEDDRNETDRLALLAAQLKNNSKENSRLRSDLDTLRHDHESNSANFSNNFISSLGAGIGTAVTQFAVATSLNLLALGISHGYKYITGKESLEDLAKKQAILEINNKMHEINQISIDQDAKRLKTFLKLIKECPNEEEKNLLMQQYGPLLKRMLNKFSKDQEIFYNDPYTFKKDQLKKLPQQLQLMRENDEEEANGTNR